LQDKNGKKPKINGKLRALDPSGWVIRIITIQIYYINVRLPNI
jgi:hypothetical protein